ncbi:MAG: DUF2207 domain-containing protein [bacterium]|nr:DUF2207 domain-containing protein [bacterium]
MTRTVTSGKPVRTLLTLMVVLAAVTAPAVGVWAKSYDHPTIDVTFRLQPEGGAEVEEVRAFRFVGSFSWAEIRRSTKGQYGTYGIRYHGVWDAGSGQAMQFKQSRDGSEELLRWSYSAADTSKRFRIRYRITDAVQRYADVAQFYWQAIEGDHAPIGRVRVTVKAPGASPGLFKVFVHSKATPGELRIAPDFRSAEITQSDIPETSFVEVRVLLDPALFPKAALRRGESHESLLADERRQSETERRWTTVFLVGLLAGSLLLAGLIAAYVWTYARYGREPSVAYEAIYEREPPRPLPPAVVPAILPQGGVRRADLAWAFAATLVEAARLGYLEIEERQGQGLLGTGLFRDTDLVYRLTDKGRALLSGRQPEETRRERSLDALEVKVLDAVFRKARKGDEVTGDEIEAWGKQIVGRKSNFLLFTEGWGPDLRKWFEDRHFRLDDAASERAKGWFIGGAVITIFVASAVGMGITAFAAVPVGIVLIGLSLKGLSRRTPEAALEVKRWEAFRRFMEDFSAMKDAGPNVLALWESYLVYATALGVAEKLIENLKLVATELGQTVPHAAWFYSASGGGQAGLTPAGLGSLEALSRSFQNFQSLSRALSSSSSSGGGFSGGGGGGGGGGSSRAG